jgi:hypothetical protein
VILSQAAGLDTRSSATLSRKDWLHLVRTSGLGLSPEESESILDAYSLNGVVRYGEILRRIRGDLTPPRADLVSKLFLSIAKDGEVPGARLLKPELILPAAESGRVSKKEARRDWEDGVAYWGSDGQVFDEDTFRAFFSFVSAITAADDEFRVIAESC